MRKLARKTFPLANVVIVIYILTGWANRMKDV